MGTPGTTLGGLLADCAAARPRHPYLTSPDDARTLTLAELEALARRVGEALRAEGLRAGERVALALANGPHLVAALFGVTAAGAVAVPFDPRLTAEEAERVLAAAGASLLVADRSHPAALSAGTAARPLDALSLEGGASPVVIRRASDRDGSSAGPPAALSPSPEDVALVLFTSGTTGRPKGVPLTHRNLVANARAVAAAHVLEPRDVALCVLPAFHINGLVVTTLAPLVSGGRVVMPRRFDAERFWRWVDVHGATWFSAVPTILSLLLSRPEPPRAPATLRFARSASAPLPVAVLEAFEARFGVPVIESLGMSEAAGQVTSNPLPPARRKPGSVGIAFGNEVRVVDAAGAPLPPGVAGEVAVRGENVFSGYLDRPPGDVDGPRDGWFRSGDLGRLDEDGYLFLTGRRGELINRAGEKIAPREVEEVLHRADGVEVACVVGVPDPLYGESVVAFVKLRPGGERAEAAIVAHCRAHLARFKVPARILFVDELPRGPNGKLQRRGLVDVYRRLTATERNAP